MGEKVEIVVMDTACAHLGSSECGSGGELRLQPSQYGLECKGQKHCSSQKRHLPFHLPILADPRRGSWETLNSTVVPIDIAGKGEVLQIPNLTPLPYSSKQSPVEAVEMLPKTQQSQGPLVKGKQHWELTKPVLRHPTHFPTIVLPCNWGELVTEETFTIPWVCGIFLNHKSRGRNSAGKIKWKLAL